VIPQATCKSELPKPQKALTKLTKAPLTTPFVSFVSGFLHPQIAKTDVLPRSRPAKASFAPRSFDDRQAPGRPGARVEYGRRVALATMRPGQACFVNALVNVRASTAQND
jgi:hypothetical protein